MQSYADILCALAKSGTSQNKYSAEEEPCFTTQKT